MTLQNTIYVCMHAWYMGEKNVQARHFNFQVHIQLILHFIDCALHRARWRRFFKNEGQCLQLIRASCKQIYQNVCVLQSTCYNYTCICISSGQGWLIEQPCPKVASPQPQAPNQTCHSLHARAHHRFGHCACQTLHAEWVYHAWVHECLSFHAWSLVHLVRQPVSSTRELQAQPTLSEGMLSHASCHMHKSSPHLATLWVQVLGNYACMHGIPLGVYHAKFTHEVML